MFINTDKNMKVIYNKILPFPGYRAINLFGLVFVREDSRINRNIPVSARTLNHEAIHSAQMRETGFIGFYILYLLEYLLKRPFFSKQKDAYYSISFEREAHAHDSDFNYLKTRKHFAWARLLRPWTKRNN